MFKIAASIVDHPLSRITLGLFGIVVTAIFGLISVILLLSNPLQEPATFAVGLGSCLGLVGWWLRLFVSSYALSRRPWFRFTLSFYLLAGVSAASYALTVMPIANSGLSLLAAMIGAGARLLLGTLAQSGPEPNNSSKGKPLRGSA